MAELDALSPNYQRAQQRWPDAPNLLKSYEALDACFSGNAHGLVEHVKAFVECVCVTIMGELREPMPSDEPSMTELLVAALKPLGLRNTRGASRLDKVLSGFNKISDALSEMRNENGPVAHGKDAFIDALTADQTRIYLHAGDAILGVILNALEAKQPDLTVTREPYESFPHLNDRIDRAVVVEVQIDEDQDRPVVVISVTTGPAGEKLSLRVEPSRLLYGIDRAAYIEVLRTADLAIAEAEPEEVKIEKAALAPAAPPHGEPPGPVALTTVIVAAYSGVLATFRGGLRAFLAAEGIDPDLAADGAVKLAESLLATADEEMGIDWKQRPQLQSRLKVACKRVFVHFGLLPSKADEGAERLVAWLRVQVPDDRVESASPRGTP